MTHYHTKTTDTIRKTRDQSISRRAFLQAAAVSATAVLLPRRLRAASEECASPNIILCMADDQGWGESSEIVVDAALEFMRKRGGEDETGPAPLAGVGRAKLQRGGLSRQTGIIKRWRVSAGFSVAEGCPFR